MRLSNFQVPLAVAGLALLAGTTAVPASAAPFTYNHGTGTHVDKRSNTPAKFDQSLEVASSSTKSLKNDTLERQIGSSILGKPNDVPIRIANASGCWRVPLDDKIRQPILGYAVGTYGMVGQWCHNRLLQERLWMRMAKLARRVGTTMATRLGTLMLVGRLV